MPNSHGVVLLFKYSGIEVWYKNQRNPYQNPTKSFPKVPMFQPGRMNEIDSFFMRSNNQVTPKRSHSPRILQQNEPLGNNLPSQNYPRGSLLAPSSQTQQFFPSSNKENCLPNRVSVSPNKIHGTKKPLLNATSNTGLPALLVSPRNKSSSIASSNGQHGNYLSGNQGGIPDRQQRVLPIMNYNSRGSNGSNGNNGHKSGNGFVKKLGMPHQQHDNVQFVMSRGPDGFMSCANHQNKSAEFAINIDSEEMVYCSGCASKLASQGFSVSRLNPQMQNSSTHREVTKAKPIPSYPEHEGNPLYEEIVNLLKDLVEVENHHYETIDRFASLEAHCDNQISLTTDYYDEVIRILTETKEDHINDLVEAKERYTQLAEIENDYLKQNVEEITYMRDDIESNISSIVTEIEEESFRQCVGEYRQKMMMLKHTVEEKEESLKGVTHYTEQSMLSRVEKFEAMMKELWSDEHDSDGQSLANKVKTISLKNQSQEEADGRHNNNNAYPKGPSRSNCPQNASMARNQPLSQNNFNGNRVRQSPNSGQNPHQISARNMHEMLPKSSVEQQPSGQGAFRHLFEDEGEETEQGNPFGMNGHGFEHEEDGNGEETLPIPSPQFKKI